MPGPLPDPNARRRNAPTIPTNTLSAKGRRGRPPKCPYQLGDAGTRWWRWAWSLPQATRWDKGSIYGLARRAQLEDELAAIDQPEPVAVAELIQCSDDDAAMLDRLEQIVRALKSMATSSTTLMREMRELDNRYGLNPKALADLRWTIAEADAAAAKRKPAAVRRLRAVDPTSQAG